MTDEGVGRERLRHLSTVLVVARDAQGERLQAASEEKRRERVERCSDVPFCVNTGEEVGRADDRARDQVGVAAEVLRRAVNDQVRPERERILVDGRRERVVDDEDRSAGVAGLSPTREVVHVEQGVRGTLEPGDPRSLRQERLGLARLPVAHESHGNAELREEVGQDGKRAAVQHVERDDLVSGLEQREEKARERAHPGTEEPGRLSALELAEDARSGPQRWGSASRL